MNGFIGILLLVCQDHYLAKQVFPKCQEEVSENVRSSRIMEYHEFEYIRCKANYEKCSKKTVTGCVFNMEDNSTVYSGYTCP